MWAKKYPVLTEYPARVRTEEYTLPLQALLDRMKRDYGYSDLDAFLVLKDILGRLYQ